MDEVSGRGSSARVTLSDNKVKNNECAQCAESGNAVGAAGFCRTCTDFLCTSCIDQHKILRGLKDHELLEDEYTLNRKRTGSNEVKCAVHPDKPIHAYCKDEDIFGCLECFKVGHRACKYVALLSDLSQGVELSKEFLDVQKATERFKTLEEQYKEAIHKCLSMNEFWHKKTLEDFQIYRSRLLSIFDEIEKNIYNEADKLKEENERQLRDLAQKVSKYSEHVKSHFLKIDEKKASKKSEQLFLALKETGRYVIDSVHRMETLHQDVRIRTFKFNSDPTITAYLSKNLKISVNLTPFLSEFGTKEKEDNTHIQTTSSPATTCISTSMVNIRSPEDSKKCCISGMVELSPIKLILSDWYNSCLKLVDLTSSTIIKRRTLASQPVGITNLPKDRVAVSLPLICQIQIFTADQSLDPCEVINVSDGCRGLYCTGDQLVVSFTYPLAQVQILDLSGNVLQVIQHDAAGNALFKRPLYHTLSQDNKFIYVSDSKKHTVTCLGMTGAVQWVYQDQELNTPMGVSTGGGGCIYVSSSDTIHVISSDGSKLAVIPQSQSGVKKPRAVFYSNCYRTLYVSSINDDADYQSYISKLHLQ